MKFNTIVPLALAGAVYAASSDDTCSSDVTAKTQSDLDAISSCKTFKANIEFDPSFSGQATINGVQFLQGSLNVTNATSLQVLAAPTLQEIDDTFLVLVAPQINALNFPQLTKVGSIQWTTLPLLSGLNFPAVVNSSKEVVISDTGLTSLEGINVKNVDTFDINNNLFLEEIDVAIESVSNELSISFNAPKVSASFPLLQWANNVTFRDVGVIKLPNITTVNNSMGFINNTVSGLGVPQLTQVGGSLAIVSNSQASNVSFPNLKLIGGGFQIANNTKLKTILGFPKVESVGGAIDWVGNFSQATLPSLDLVKGGVDVESSSSDFNCSSWNDLHSNGDIHGDSYVCKFPEHSTSVSLVPSATSAGSSSTDAASSASATASSSSSKGAAGALAPMDFGVAGAMAAFVYQLV